MTETDDDQPIVYNSLAGGTKWHHSRACAGNGNGSLITGDDPVAELPLSEARANDSLQPCSKCVVGEGGGE